MPFRLHFVVVGLMKKKINEGKNRVFLMPTTQLDSMAEDPVDIKSIIERAEISIVLDTYDDIFSDFDPRPYNERTLSEDFLYEAKRAVRDKIHGIELRLLIPKGLRSTANEELIKLRLKSHFRKHYKKSREGHARRNRQAIVLIAVGSVIGLIDAFMLSLNGLEIIFKDSLEIVLTPASWYTIWTGFDHLMVRPKEDAADEDFYKKMVDAQVTFMPY